MDDQEAEVCTNPPGSINDQVENSAQYFGQDTSATDESRKKTAQTVDSDLINMVDVPELVDTYEGDATMEQISDMHKTVLTWPYTLQLANERLGHNPNLRQKLPSYQLAEVNKLDGDNPDITRVTVNRKEIGSHRTVFSGCH